MDRTVTARIDLQKLQILNDRLALCLDALHQVRMSAHNSQIGAPANFVPGFAPNFAPHFAQNFAPNFANGFNTIPGIGYGHVPAYGINGLGVNTLGVNPYGVNAFGIPAWNTAGIPAWNQGWMHAGIGATPVTGYDVAARTAGYSNGAYAPSVNAYPTTSTIW